MKFKAFFTQDGMNLLDKRMTTHSILFPSHRERYIIKHLMLISIVGFLPALEKMGRICYVYLTPDHAMFLHGLYPEGRDEPQCVAQFARDLLFRDYRISSQVTLSSIFCFIVVVI
jgi:HUS1 checkpoint protein